MNKPRARQFVFLCLLGVLFGTGAAWYTADKEMNAGYGADYNVSSIEPAAGDFVAGTEIGGSFSLTDHDGHAVTEENYKASYKLVYFGFTSCPEICPAGLQKMTATLKTLETDADFIQPLFITIDPERDTVEVMKKYVGMFYPRLIGLTGSTEQIKSVEDKYKVYAAKVTEKGLSDYTMNHSSYMFFMSPDNKLIYLFSAEDTSSDMAQKIKQALSQT